MPDQFDEMAGRVQLDAESYALRQSIDGRRRVIAEALRAAYAEGATMAPDEVKHHRAWSVECERVIGSEMALRADRRKLLAQRDAAKARLGAVRKGALQEGFDIAVEHAWISEHDGWVRTAPTVEWDRARVKLAALIEGEPAPDTEPAPDDTGVAAPDAEGRLLIGDELLTADDVRERLAVTVCARCNDTHRMWLSDLGREVMCTGCPLPCLACRQGGVGPFCETTPCPCGCHREVDRG